MANQKRVVRLYAEDADYLWTHRIVVNGEKETIADALRRILKKVDN
jgi:hypothetical protein